MGALEVKKKTISCWSSFHLVEFTCVCELFPFARRENDSQVGDRVVTATLRHSINARWFACTYDKVILHIRILHITA
jgi:hypothetical protein